MPVAMPYPAREPQRTATHSPSPAISLLEYTSRVREAIKQRCGQPEWIQAELSEVRLNTSGHCYIDFVQKDARGSNIVARARGIIWRNLYPSIRRKFLDGTGRELSAGIKVMVQVTASFSELYGFSLTVYDIEPAYTVGDMELRRRQIIDQLRADGVLTLNRELPFPDLPLRIAVISSATAAGYGDFCTHLNDTGSGFPFRVELFPAVMQGEQTEESVLSALDDIYCRCEEFDVVVLIRGGGASSDLSCFDNYDIACALAQFPLPVVAGIGHERDRTVVDEVAHTSVKTPTAVANLLVDCMRTAVNRLIDASSRLQRAATAIVKARHDELEALSSGLPKAVHLCLSQQRLILDGQRVRLRERSHNRLQGEDARLRYSTRRLTIAIPKRLSAGHIGLAYAEERLRNAAGNLMQRRGHKLQLIRQRVADLSPQRILDRGYSITLRNGKAVRSADQLSPGDNLTTRLANGEVHSVVT